MEGDESANRDPAERSESDGVADPGASLEDARPTSSNGVDTGGAEAETARDAIEHPHCDLCGAPMIERHCKLVCMQCGYLRDCSDP